MVSEYLVKLCAIDGTPYRLYSTHAASDTEIIPTFAIISICADFDNGTISLRYYKPNVENKPTELVLIFDKSVSEPLQRFVSEVQSDIVRRETLFETNRLKAEAEVGDIPAYDRTEPKRRKYNYASGRIEGDEISDCYGEYKGDGTYYLGDYVGGKMHGNGYLRLTIEDDPSLAAPDETEIYEGIFVGNSFRFGEAFRDGGGVTVTYGEFSGRNASGYGTRRTCSYGYCCIYEGSFEADSFSGFGRYADLDEKYIYVGEFSHGLPYGVGDMILENGVTVHCDTVSRGSVVGADSQYQPKSNTF